MKNHFYISYNGNKRNEAENFYNSIDLSQIKTIIEPFCGTSAISYYIWTMNPDLKFVLNDNNKFIIEMYNIMKDDEKLKAFEDKINLCIIPEVSKNKESYVKFIKENNNIFGWFVSYKFFNIRPGLFPLINKFSKIDFKKFPVYNFYKNAKIEFYNLDGLEIYEKYKMDNKNLIIMDPPYLNTDNDFYFDSNTNIYEYLYKNDIIKEKSKIYLILEDNWIIKMLFNKYIIQSYDKRYQTTKKNTTHIIIYNKKSNKQINKNLKNIEYEEVKG